MRLVIALLLVGSQGFAQTLKRAEYFFDTDPGKGNGTSISVTQGASINETHNINVSSLGSGTHTIGLRVLDSNGEWSHSATRTFFIVAPVVTATATSLNKAEYFFDSDPGAGHATPIAISSSSAENNSFVIDISSLSAGFHQLCIRYQDNLWQWSAFANRTFYIVPVINNVIATAIKKAEYFFDTDPGLGQGTSLSIAPSGSENNSFVINISSLASGFHQLAIRYKDDKGHWSMFAHRTFYIVPTVNVLSSSSIKSAEYFFDSDPGLGNGTSLPISSSSSENNLFAINISSLLPGFHQLAIRYKDDKGHWSLFTNRTFYIVPPASVGLSAAVKKAEYFFDTDPGAGHGTALSLTPSGGQDNTFALDVSALSKGFHQLMIRYQDDKGRWSLFGQRTFYIFPGSIVSTTLQKIEYFIDNDPGINKATPLSFNAAPTVNQAFTIDLGTTPPGSHVLYVRTKDSNGYWSAPVVSAPFSIASCTVPLPPVGTNGSRCDAGSVTLSASGASGTQQYRWYNDGTTSTIAFTGPSFSTPSITGNTDYYSSVFDPSTGCESSRTKISAIVTVIPKPTLSPSGALTLCQGNSLNIVAPVGYVGYVWSNSATTPSITTSTSASYTVTVSDGTCSSPQSDPLVLTVVPRPAKPIVQALSSPIVCGNGTVTLAAPTGAASYLWSDGETTQQITSATTGSYTVQIMDANSCQSVSSDPIAVQILPVPSKPIVQVFGSAVLCKNASAVLAAPAGFSKYVWSSGDTTAQISVASAGNYSVKVGSSLCMSVPSDAVTVSLANQLIKPIVQASGSTTICGNGSVQLSAPIGASSYLWSDGETTQQIMASATANYTVQISDANNCQSISSDPVAVQILQAPNKPIIKIFGSTTLCKNGSVILAAPAGFAKYTWSSGDTTAQIAVSTAGNYSVMVGNSLCMSVPSDAVTVSLANQLVKPIVQVNGSTTICGNGSVVLSAPVGAASYLWSDGETTQQIAASSTANYTVQITDANNCQSVSSDPIPVQVLPMPNKPIVTPLSSTVLCKNANVILSAPIGFSKYRWSNGDTTAQTVIGSAGTYTVKVGNAICMSVSSDITTVTFAAVQPKPVIQVTSGSLAICGSGSVTLKAPSASGYLWSDGSTSQTISPSTAGRYSVVVTDANNCLSDASDQVSVQVIAVPATPIITTYGSTALCNGASVILSATSGFLKYKWSSGDTTAQVLTSTDGNYSVQVGYAANCFSASSPSIAVTHTNQPCTRTPSPSDVPPSIANATIAVPVGTAVTFGLRKLIKKADHGAGVNLSTLRIAFPLANGTNALITTSDSLWIDFKGTSYVGVDSIGIQVCDSLGSCTERTLIVNVVAQIEVFNAVSPYPDGLNDFFNLKFIDKIDETKKNKVTIVDRWGNEVFSASDYNNVDRVFIGNDNNGKELPSGTYYYRIDFESGRPTLSGFLSLKR